MAENATRPTVEELEYRLVWKRVGLAIKRKRFARRSTVDRFALLLGPEPWRYHDKDPGEFMCCSGRECGCDGQTWRQYDAEQRRILPPLEWVRVETRPVGRWVAAPSNVGRAPSAAAARSPQGAASQGPTDDETGG